MSNLNRRQEAALIECLRALDRGESLEACLARASEDAEVLRPLLELRARMQAIEPPAPGAAAYELARQRLLSRVRMPAPAEPSRRLLPALAWTPPALFGRAIMAGVAISLLAGGALGAAAAVGGNPVSDALSALHIIENDSSEEDVRGGAIDGEETATVLPDSTVPLGPPAPADTSRPEEIPGVGLCFAEDKSDGLPDDIVEVFPDAGACIPEALLEYPADGAPCVPPDLAQRFEQPPVDLPVCGDGDAPPAEGAQPPLTPPPPPVGPPSEPPAGPPPPVEPPSEPPAGPPPPVEPQSEPPAGPPVDPPHSQPDRAQPQD